MSGRRIHISGVAIPMYWWMRASGMLWVIAAGPFGAVSSGSGAPDAIACAVSPSIPRSSVSSRVREPRRAECEQERIGHPAVRVVGCEEDLLWRHLPHQILFATDYRSGRMPNALVSHSARRGSRGSETELRGMRGDGAGNRVGRPAPDTSRSSVSSKCASRAERSASRSALGIRPLRVVGCEEDLMRQVAPQQILFRNRLPVQPDAQCAPARTPLGAARALRRDGAPRDARGDGAGNRVGRPAPRASAESPLVEEQLQKAVARSNKLIEKQIDADADELEREIEAAAKEDAS